MAVAKTIRLNEDIDAVLTNAIPISYLDTDQSLAADSQAKVASQDATKAYADTKLALAGGTVTGTLTLEGSLIENIVVVTDTYQILATDSTVICNKTTAFTVTLPTAVVGKKITIKNINTGLVTLEGSGADTIDGELNQTINQWDAIKVQCYAANSWIII